MEKAMIADWLADMPLPYFVETYLQRQPFVRPGTASGAIALLDWQTVGHLVSCGADMLVVRDGALRQVSAPAPLALAWRLFEQGHSLVIRGADEHDQGLRELAASVARDLPGEVAVQVFATPAGYGSFGWHYDCEDVFIVQTAGVKDYRLRQNTVNPRPTLDAMPRNMQFERETTPVLACTLVPGDWLYVPRGWWHTARATEASLSLSIGVLSAEARGTRGPASRAWHRP
jgi:50S ribosomal protein L16 3-hydroxylase